MTGRTSGTETETQVGGEKVEGDGDVKKVGVLWGRDGDAMTECLAKQSDLDVGRRLDGTLGEGSILEKVKVNQI
eukprot:CAMPEP_0184650402 /NCGR_PEP_ID=MMETSP0308-20130426/7930_1 /TAXON_ID=38269 /ORGANISM="Gloeochaete witrockiana, Strain SAG 46.84" /LENGTH=73 /DNA_ID=CAMNT_0027083893 /DNA_START=55 /DNA_END=274 /DNA_ORIENTATION=+